MASMTRYRTGASAIWAAVAVMAAACGSAPDVSPTSSASASGSAAPALQRVPITISDDLIGADDPFGGQQFADLPPGWSISVWARLRGARIPVSAPDGSLLVTSPVKGVVVRYVADQSGKADQSTVLSGLKQPHGLVLKGNVLFVAESNAITAYDYRDGKASNRQVIADGLPDAKSGDLGGQYAHALKNLVLGKDGSLFYSVGSTTNTSVEDRDAVPERAVIMRIPPGGGAPEVFARGVRNGTGLAIAPDGSLWTAVNHRDDIPYPYDRPFGAATSSSRGMIIEQYVRDHPVEQLARLTPGRDLGWPFCNSDPDVDPGVAGTAFDFTTPAFVPDATLNPDGARFDCSTLEPVEQSIEAHAAPLGMEFATLPAPYGSGAVVALHGSWNANPPRAPEVAFFPLVNGTLGARQTLIGGFQRADHSRWGGRPVAVTVAPDGVLYVTDDTANAIYKVVPPGRR